MPKRRSPINVLTCIRSAYPGGVVPGTDYPALLAVLQQHLPVDDVVRVATELIIQGVSPFTGTDLRDAITALLPDQVLRTDVERVTQHLRAGGWTLEDITSPPARCVNERSGQE